MNQTTFEVGDRVRHKVTQIEGEIVQTEQSLAMPHVWVIEPSEREVNPLKLYRIVDLEKIESLGDKQTLTKELLEDIFDTTACDQFNISSSNSSTLNKCNANHLSSSNDVLLEDKKEVLPPCNDLTSNQMLEDKYSILQSSPQRRVKGDGSGCIYRRTVVRNGKEYQQAYYQYEFWQDGHCLVKTTKYIPKKLLKQVLKLNQDKAPVLEILEVLGVVQK